MPDPLQILLEEISKCRICRDQPRRKPLAHEPRPVLRASPTARIAVCGQAPGTRVHASGKPFTDPSGDRLRNWMAVDCDTFYDTGRIAIVPMGFCFPGLDAKGGDLPPRPECAPVWRQRVFDHLAELRVILLVGAYAVRWHLGADAKANLTDTVAAWRDYTALAGNGSGPAIFPLPHPSWRNNAWLKRHAWFEAELLPELQGAIRQQLA